MDATEKALHTRGQMKPNEAARDEMIERAETWLNTHHAYRVDDLVADFALEQIAELTAERDRYKAALEIYLKLPNVTHKESLCGSGIQMDGICGFHSLHIAKAALGSSD